MAPTAGNRILLVGAGDVGAAYAYALVNQGITHDLAIIDLNETKARGEVEDLNHGVVWAPSPTNVRFGSYEADSAGAALLVITAGAAQKPGETRLELVDKNLKITGGIIKNCIDNGFKGIILMATNPVDVLSYAAWKTSGLPSNQVVGSGTTLDSARFRYLLGQLYDVAPMSVHATVVGEHGDSELPALSSATIAGVPIADELARHPERRLEIEEAFYVTVTSAQRIIKAKGSTSFGIGMALARISRAILEDQHVALPVSTLLSGEYGQQDVYMGTPAVLGRGGVERVVQIPLSEDEQKRFSDSGAALHAVQDPYFQSSDNS
ncbi:L-lactate dehydrogenase [Raineyella fluvialis]|uniref:L-lactate dehydrogenase n=1 Tax=Raineyella fluvialis TaxID=2662261 RepID=A0A5Q2F8P0_9ACTN|nr:L-lactate dehydrogenase [Raineyella fluvialis]QGF23320.1 L-lactate dehydrogenase [Raineyella fluvialis]